MGPLLKKLSLFLKIFRSLAVLVIKRHLTCGRRYTKHVAPMLHLFPTVASEATAEIFGAAQILLFLMSLRLETVVPLRPPRMLRKNPLLHF